MEEKWFKIVFTETGQEHFLALDRQVQNIIKIAIEGKLATNPIEFGKPLQHSLRGHRRLRVGNFRIIYRIDYPTRTVSIVAIAHRKDIYS